MAIIQDGTAADTLIDRPNTWDLHRKLSQSTGRFYSAGVGKESYMSELSDTGRAARVGLAGRTPNESDVPSMQGLDDSVDDPGDPMPDMSGSSVSR